MKKSKKVLSLLLIATLVMSLSSVSVFAATLDQDTTSGSATVAYTAGQISDDKGTEDPSDDTISGTYTISIPEYINVAAVGDNPTVYNVTAQNVLIPYNSSLEVSIDFDKTLHLSDNASTTLTYDMLANPQSTGKLSSIESGAIILTVAAGNPDAVTTSNVAAILTQKPSYAGVYKNTANFSVIVSE